MSDDDTMVLIFAGSVAAIIIGLLAYAIMKKNSEIPPISLQIDGESNQNPTMDPTSYYLTADIAPAPETPAPDNSIIQNEEKITWTDWQGRDRSITISRVVH